MRVLWFSNTPAAGDEFFNNNGTGGWLKSLDKAIQNEVELHVAFYNRSYPSEFTVGKTCYHQLAPYDKISRIKRQAQLILGKNPELPKCLELTQSLKPDLIHIHGTEKPWIDLAAHTDIPVLLSIQAILTVMNYKYFSGIQKSDIPYSSAYIKSYKGFLKEGEVELRGLKYLKYIMGRTDWDRRVYSVLAPRAQYFTGGEVLRDGFYTAVWNKPQRKNNKIIVHTTTGTLLFKGFETICAAVDILNRIGVDIEWRVAGVPENSDFVKIVRGKLKGKYPAKGLIMLGALQEGSLIEKMLEADIYVSPSHQDNSPNALCEATMLGMPCISTFAGGSGSILKDGETGIMIQDGDPWAMAGAVLELAHNESLAKKYANNARKDALRRHDKNIIIGQVIDAYKSILNE